MELLDPSPHPIANFHHSHPIPLIISESDEQKVFYVHETLLVATSEYFRVALQSNSTEGQEKQCSLPDDDSDAFHCFVQYLCKGDYRVTLARPALEGGEQQYWFLLHARCFALGSKLVTPSFKKYVVYQLAHVLRNGRDPPTMETMLAMARVVYEGTLPPDARPMRDLLASYCSSRLGSKGGYAAEYGSIAWRPLEIERLINCQQTELIMDIMGMVRGPSSIDVETFMRQHYISQS